MVQSGGFVKQSFDLANVRIISVVDDSLKFTLHYAASEKLALNDLIDIAIGKFQTYKNLTWKSLKEHRLIKSQLERGGVKKIFEDEKSKLDVVVAVKIESARNGWLNQEKIHKKISQVWYEIWWVTSNIAARYLANLTPLLDLSLAPTMILRNNHQR